MRQLNHAAIAFGAASALAVLTLAGCGPSPSETSNSGAGPAAPAIEAPTRPNAAIPEVDAALLSTPNDAFVAIEPTDIGVIGAPDMREAIAPLISVELLGEGEAVQLSIRESGDAATADIVRSGMLDDAVAAGHVRIEFRREPEGWFPTNAYRRSQCRRGAAPGQWTTEPCP